MLRVDYHMSVAQYRDFISKHTTASHGNTPPALVIPLSSCDDIACSGKADVFLDDGTPVELTLDDVTVSFIKCVDVDGSLTREQNAGITRNILEVGVMTYEFLGEKDRHAMFTALLESFDRQEASSKPAPTPPGNAPVKVSWPTKTREYLTRKSFVVGDTVRWTENVHKGRGSRRKLIGTSTVYADVVEAKRAKSEAGHGYTLEVRTSTGRSPLYGMGEAIARTGDFLSRNGAQGLKWLDEKSRDTAFGRPNPGFVMGGTRGGVAYARASVQAEDKSPTLPL